MESKAVKEGKSIIFNQEFLHDILSLRFTRAERKMISMTSEVLGVRLNEDLAEKVFR